MPRRAADWDAPSYHQVAKPHAAWGTAVLDRLALRGDEVVLDAGCGSGKVTAQLLARLPTGKVVAADQSPAMLAEARVNLAAWAAQVSFVQVDLLEIDRVLQAPVDVVFSTAVFHWIPDHPRLFAALHASLSRPGGRLIAQCGGAGNLAGFMRATDEVAAQPSFADFFAGKQLWRFFATPAETEARLRAAGFTAAEAWLEPSPQTFADAPALADFVRAVVLSSHVAELPQPMQADFTDQVVQAIGRAQAGFTLDYVRLNLAAQV